MPTPSVLIVEDDAVNRDVFTRIVTRAGYSVTQTENGIEALEALRQQDFQAIVTDIKMPGLSGKAFYEQLEELSPQMAGRVIFVTAFADDPGLRQFFRDTGQPVLQKPVKMQALVEAVKSVTEKQA